MPHLPGEIRVGIGARHLVCTHLLLKQTFDLENFWQPINYLLPKMNLLERGHWFAPQHFEEAYPGTGAIVFFEKLAFGLFDRLAIGQRSGRRFACSLRIVVCDCATQPGAHLWRGRGASGSSSS